MKSANIINCVVVKSIIFVIGLTIGVFSANAFYKIVFSPVDRIEIRPLLENVKDFELSNWSPNIFILNVKADVDRNLFLDGKKAGTLENFDLLIARIKEIFKERKENGVFDEDTDNIAKQVIVVPNSIIKDNDLFNLVEALELSGANPILIDWNNELPKPKRSYCPLVIRTEKIKSTLTYP